MSGVLEKHCPEVNKSKPKILGCPLTCVFKTQNASKVEAHEIVMQKTQVASRMFPALPTREDIQEYVLWHCIDIMSKQSYHPYVVEQRKHVGSHFVIPFFLLCLSAMCFIH